MPLIFFLQRDLSCLLEFIFYKAIGPDCETNVQRKKGLFWNLKHFRNGGASHKKVPCSHFNRIHYQFNGRKLFHLTHR